MRAFLGFIAGVIAMLLFHQGLVQAMHALGWTGNVAWQVRPVWPFGAPQIVSQCFWGGIYAAIYATVIPRLGIPRWLGGVLLGLISALIGWLVVAPLKGLPVMSGHAPGAMARFLAVNLAFGLGTVLVLPLLRPRRLRRA